MNKLVFLFPLLLSGCAINRITPCYSPATTNGGLVQFGVNVNMSDYSCGYDLNSDLVSNELPDGDNPLEWPEKP